MVHLALPGGHFDQLISYLVAAAMIPLGFFATWNLSGGLTNVARWAILFGVLAPASLVTGNWIARAFRRRSR